jgi:chromosome segregation ATPase
MTLLEREEEQLDHKVEKITKDIDEAVEAKNSLQNEYNTLLKKNEQAKRNQKEYSEKLREIHQSLQEAKADIEV